MEPASDLSESLAAAPSDEGGPPPDIEGGGGLAVEGLAEPAAQPPRPGLLATALEKAGVTAAVEKCSGAVGKAAADAGAALSARWEQDKNFRLGCTAAAAVAFVLFCIFHLLANWRRLAAVLGMAAIIGGCYLGSTERGAVSWPRTFSALGLQLLMGVLITYTALYSFFLWLGELVQAALVYANEGGDFVFASYDEYGKQTPLAGLHPTAINITVTEGSGADKVSRIATVLSEVGSRPMGSNFAIAVLPSIIFFSALVEVMNHLGILPWLMKVFAWVFCAFTRCTVPEGVSAAANVFVGMTNAPLLIKPFMSVATPSHLVAIMGAGFGTAGASMLPVYISMGAPPVHLLAAAWMGAPASLTCAKLLMPDSKDGGGVASDYTIDKVRPQRCQNVVEAMSRGVNDGTAISIGVAANLIAILGLVAFVNGMIGWASVGLGLGKWTLDRIFGYVFTPLAILMGASHPPPRAQQRR